MAVGICKTKGGWGNQDSAKVRYDDGTILEVPKDQYEDKGYEPPFYNLPECPKDSQRTNRT